jgi:tryptophan-rich sensory protein
MNTTKIKLYAMKHPYLVAVLFYALMNLIAGYSITLFVDIKAVYAALNTPTWAPATWVFGVAWTINNILVLIGNVWTIQSPVSSYRSTLIRLQIASWINYAVFQWLSFGTGIPAMFFIPTFTMLLLTLASIYYAYKIDITNNNFSLKKFRQITLTFTTLLVWLSVASLLGYYIMTNS